MSNTTATAELSVQRRNLLAHRMARFLLGTLAVFGVLVSVAVSVSAQIPEIPTSIEPQQISWSIMPSGADGAMDRVSVHQVLDPGSDVVDHAAIANFTSHPIRLDLRVVVASADEAGALTWNAPHETPDSRESSIDFQTPTSLTIPGGERSVISYTISTPPNAGAGDHTMALEARIIKDLGAEGLPVDVQYLRINARVAGPVQPEVTIDSVSAHYVRSDLGIGPGSAQIKYKVTNSGNMTVAGSIVPGLEGLYSRRIDAPPEALARVELVPGSTFTGEATIAGVWPLVRFDAAVAFVPSNVSGFDIPDPPVAPPMQQVLWTLPSTELAAGICIVVVAVAARWRTRRRRRRDAINDVT
ncbi:hypothetical protein [Rhodococcus erythropolis]|uniref:hypothetical protein n=1 Tax=Rhodococcus erythropolis TaxID=1833 RepID=UPI000878ED17|nr:hypothetical protein [Rhodococcus erythropolis]OFV73527.1 hypothetical protein RERY_58530 [Rhodococcus erythropolis]